MPYTGDDVRALIKVTSRINAAMTAINAVGDELAALPIDTAGVAEIVREYDIARSALSRARRMLDVERVRVAVMVEYHGPLQLPTDYHALRGGPGLYSDGD